MKDMMTHLKEHQTYPATKAELVANCNQLEDFSKEDKEWFEKSLENRTYRSADEVMQIVGMRKRAGQMM